MEESFQGCLSAWGKGAGKKSKWAGSDWIGLALQMERRGGNCRTAGSEQGNSTDADADTGTGLQFCEMVE